MVMCALLGIFITQTDTGRAIRAVAKERMGARLVGIDVDKVFAISFGLGMATLGAAASTVLVADNPPVSAITGNLWFNTTDLNTYVYYNDGNSNQWIAIGIEDPATAASILPSQTGNSGRYLTTDGTSTSWSTVQALPSQTGNSGRYLTTDGTTASWNTVQALPSQTGNSGKYLTTDGTTASWTALSAIVFDGGAPDTVYTTGPVFDAGGVT
jgi:hypothetical protein